MPSELTMKAMFVPPISALVLAACVARPFPTLEVRDLPPYIMSDNPVHKEEIEAGKVARIGCTILPYIFSGIGSIQEEARTHVRAQVAEAGGNAVEFFSGWGPSPGAPEGENYGENGNGYACRDISELRAMFRPDDVTYAVHYDLDFDGAVDAMVVSESDSRRSLSFVYQNEDGAHSLGFTNHQALLCKTCDGDNGDPFGYVSYRRGAISVTHSIGPRNQFHTAEFRFDQSLKQWRLSRLASSLYDSQDSTDLTEDPVDIMEAIGHVSLEEYNVFSVLESYLGTE